MVKITPEAALRQAIELEKLGERLKARRLYLAYLKKYPRNFDALSGLSRITKAVPSLPAIKAPKNLRLQLQADLDAGRAIAVLDQLEPLMVAHPTDAHLWSLRGYAQITNRREDLARGSFRRAIELSPRMADAHTGLAIAHQHSYRDSEAHHALLIALQCDPDHAVANALMGQFLINRGQKSEGLELCQKALEIDPEQSVAHRLMAEHKRFTPDDPQFAVLKGMLAKRRLTKRVSVNLLLALSKAYRDIGEFELGMSLLTEAKSAKKRQYGFDMSYDRKVFAHVRRSDQALGDFRIVDRPPSFTPIFILGMPRSGTTLTEQILACHSKVAAGGELSFMSNAVKTQFETDAPITKDLLWQVRRDYLKDAETLTKGRPFLTDKMPHNFVWLGVIARALPEAKIIHLDRDARAVCWSNFKTYFNSPAKLLGYSCDLSDIVQHYTLYRDLMAYWRRSHPGAMLDFNYEALTQAPEAQSRALLDWIGLDWQEACLAPQDNVRKVNTASKTQVQEPIYTGSSQDWEKYRPYLGGVFDALPTGPQV